MLMSGKEYLQSIRDNRVLYVGRERVVDQTRVVAYEVMKTTLTDDETRAMIEEALKEVALRHGVRVFDLLLMRPGLLPRTTSGKAQRDHCRTLYLSGELARMAYDGPHPSLGRYQSTVVRKPNDAILTNAPIAE